MSCNNKSVKIKCLIFLKQEKRCNKMNITGAKNGVNSALPLKQCFSPKKHIVSF